MLDQDHAADHFGAPPSVADLEAAGLEWERADDEDELEIARDNGFVALRDPCVPGSVRIMDEDDWAAFCEGSDQYDMDADGLPRDYGDAAVSGDATD